jgi:hypothetical protein
MESSELQINNQMIQKQWEGNKFLIKSEFKYAKYWLATTLLLKIPEELVLQYQRTNCNYKMDKREREKLNFVKYVPGTIRSQLHLITLVWILWNWWLSQYPNSVTY